MFSIIVNLILLIWCWRLDDQCKKSMERIEQLEDMLDVLCKQPFDLRCEWENSEAAEMYEAENVLKFDPIVQREVRK